MRVMNAHTRLPSMSRTESLVMELLRGRERYGLELVDTSDGALKRGSVYVILARMEEKGFVESRLEERSPTEGGMARRLYRATPYGRKVHGAFAMLRDALSLKPAEAE
jgi:DNA-binding PadR family transcriptional regulator